MKYRDRYIVACSFCGASVGRACYERSSFQATGRKIWAPVHLARKRAVANTFHRVTTADANA